MKALVVSLHDLYEVHFSLSQARSTKQLMTNWQRLIIERELF